MLYNIHMRITPTLLNQMTLITFGHGDTWDVTREWPETAMEQLAVIEQLDPQACADWRVSSSGQSPGMLDDDGNETQEGARASVEYYLAHSAYRLREVVR